MLHILPSGSHTVGLGSGWACRWPRRCSRCTPGRAAAATTCCSDNTKQTAVKHRWGRRWFIAAKIIMTITATLLSLITLTAVTNDTTHTSPCACQRCSRNAFHPNEMLLLYVSGSIKSDRGVFFLALRIAVNEGTSFLFVKHHLAALSSSAKWIASHRHYIS